MEFMRKKDVCLERDFMRKMILDPSKMIGLFIDKGEKEFISVDLKKAQRT